MSDIVIPSDNSKSEYYTCAYCGSEYPAVLCPFNDRTTGSRHHPSTWKGCPSCKRRNMPNSSEYPGVFMKVKAGINFNAVPCATCPSRLRCITIELVDFDAE